MSDRRGEMDDGEAQAGGRGSYARVTSTVEAPSASERAALRQRAARRGVLGAVGVLGELLLTAGVFVFLFLGWQLWLNNAVAEGAQTGQAIAVSEEWASEYVPGPVVVDVPKADEPASGPPAPEFSATPGDAEIFATMIVPRFGADWTRPIAEGVGLEAVLNPIGVGHYPGTAMPGGVGNFAVAAHRTTWGSPFFNISQFEVGDSIYIEVPDGWYRYEFRAHEYVLPDGVEVLAEVPQAPGMPGVDRIITMTSCNPVYSQLERYIAYGVYADWTPRSAGPPAEIAHLYGPV